MLVRTFLSGYSCSQFSSSSLVFRAVFYPHALKSRNSEENGSPEYEKELKSLIELGMSIQVAARRAEKEGDELRKAGAEFENEEGVDLLSQHSSDLDIHSSRVKMISKEYAALV